MLIRFAECILWQLAMLSIFFVGVALLSPLVAGIIGPGEPESCGLPDRWRAGVFGEAWIAMVMVVLGTVHALWPGVFGRPAPADSRSLEPFAINLAELAKTVLPIAAILFFGGFAGGCP